MQDVLQNYLVGTHRLSLDVPFKVLPATSECVILVERSTVRAANDKQHCSLRGALLFAKSALSTTPQSLQTAESKQSPPTVALTNAYG